MRVIIAGGRDYTDYDTVVKHVRKSGLNITEVVSGGATGADRLGERYAALHDIALNRKPADWRTHGKAAGPIRNTQMAEYADALIAFWDGKSPGTKHMIRVARKHNLLVYVYNYTDKTVDCDYLHRGVLCDSDDEEEAH